MTISNHFLDYATAQDDIDEATAVVISETSINGETVQVIEVSTVISTLSFEVAGGSITLLDTSPRVVADTILNGPTVDPVAGAALRGAMRTRLITERAGINSADDADHALYLLMAAAKVRPEDINYMARYGRGLICLTISRERCAQFSRRRGPV